MPKGIKRTDTLISLVLLKNLCNAPGKKISRSPPIIFSISNKSHDNQYNQPIPVIDQIRFRSKGREIRINISITFERDCLFDWSSRLTRPSENCCWWFIPAHFSLVSQSYAKLSSKYKYSLQCFHDYVCLQANGLRYPRVGGTRQRRFDGTSLKPRRLPENAQSPTRRVHAVLGSESCR